MTTTSPHSADPAATATITPAELVQLRDADPAVHVIDVRTPGEFETAHIAGSYNVPLDQLGEHADEVATLGHTVVLVCQSGARATKAMDRLVGAGKSNLRLLEGGMNAWQRAGADVARGNRQRWALERQVRLVAGLLVVAAVVASFAWPPARLVAGFVGAGLTFAAVSDTCAMGAILMKLPYNRGAGCDLDAVIDQLVAAEAGVARSASPSSDTASLTTAEEA